jgi:hypothetical protein
MESFEIKGDNGTLKIGLKEVFGYPDQTSPFGGYDAKATIEIEVPNYHVLGDFYTTTGEIFSFDKALKKCQEELKGEAEYLTYEGNFGVKINYTESGRIKIRGKFQQHLGIENCLSFEISGDQSFMKFTIDQLALILKKYG